MPLVAALALAVGACTSDSDVADAPSDGPAACAGAAAEGLAEVRAAQWSAATQALAGDPNTQVWLGFSRILSIDDVADLPGGLTVHGLQLVYEQQQGTYLKAQQNIDPAATDDPAFGEQARQLLARSDHGAPPLPLPGIAPDAMEPTDPDVVAGDPPISALLITGDVATVLEDVPCLVHAMTPGGFDPPAAISPTVEPEQIHLDAG